MEQKKVSFDIRSKKFLRDYILVQTVDVDKPTSFIIDPRQYNDKPEIGVVISLSDSIESIKVGDAVLFNQYMSTKYRNPATSEDFYVVREEDIICH